MSNRPLSPHLQIYRPQMTSVLSIVHRATGVIIALGALVIAWWLWSIILGADAHASASGFLTSPIGILLLFAWSACTCYHLFNGIRHLVWDSGRGFEMDQAEFMGKLVLVATVIVTALVWLL